MTCAKCDSSQIIDGVRILDSGQHSRGDLTAAAYEKPAALIFKGEVTSKLVGRMCGSCGYLELFAADPGALLDVARRVGRPT